MNVGGYEGAPSSGEFAVILENHTGNSGPRGELLHILEYLHDLRGRQRALGFPESCLTYLYDIPVWVVDNCAGNRGQHGGLIVMIDLVRAHEYRYLKVTSRPFIGPYIETRTSSCQLHDSNLINTELSRCLRYFDLNAKDDLDPTSPFSTMEKIRGNKSTESFSYNAVRFLASLMKKDKDWRAFMLFRYGDNGGIKPIKSARFWAAMLVGMYLYKRIDFMLDEFCESKDHSNKQVGGTLEEVRARRKLFKWELLMMGVDYRGFHSPWNKKASAAAKDNADWSLEDQAKYVKAQRDFHKKCIESAGARDAYWREHAASRRTRGEVNRSRHARGGGGCGAGSEQQAAAASGAVAITPDLMTTPLVFRWVPACSLRACGVSVALLDWSRERRTTWLVVLQPSLAY
jgi:hypothetical protein